MKAKNKFSQLYLPLLFLTIDSANASEECGKINDDYKRLDCYDALYKDNPIAKTNVISDFREIENSKDQTQDSTKIKNSPKVVATIKSADSSKTKIMGIFSTAKPEEKPKLDEKKQITYVITKVKISPDGKYIIYSDKLRFKLNDYIKKSFRPKPGVKFTIRESSFGGYRIKFEGLNREYRIKS
ncbi:hypothetical protein N9333_00345 [Gammaproteobacteria bacterium]|nr:hypothetical protein [Gammaproteobacteria bacterium]